MKLLTKPYPNKTLTKNKLYINTLTPYFKFKNKIGNTIKPKNCCIYL